MNFRDDDPDLKKHECDERLDRVQNNYHQNVNKNSSIISIFVLILRHCISSVVPALHRHLSSTHHLSSLYKNIPRLVSKPSCVCFVGISKCAFSLFLVSASTILTLKPLVGALELNASSTASSIVDATSRPGRPSTVPVTTEKDAFNWSSGFFDPTFGPHSTPNSVSTG